MAMLSWLKLNKHIETEYTVKKFHGKYLYKLKLHVPCWRLATSIPLITKNGIKHRIHLEISKSLASASIFVKQQLHHLYDSDADQLFWLITELSAIADDISIRVENPTLTIYGKSEEQLYWIASKCPMDKSRVLAITVPKENTAEDLDNDIIFVKRDNGYKYKIMTKEGSFPLDTKLHLFNYLTSLKHEVKLTSGYIQRLTQYQYAPASYIYTNDEKIVSFLKLIAPGMISKIYELKVLE